VHGLFPRVHDLFPRVHGLFPRVHGLFPRVHDLFPPVHDLFPPVHDLCTRVHDLCTRLRDVSAWARRYPRGFPHDGQNRAVGDISVLHLAQADFMAKGLPHASQNLPPPVTFAWQ
jgi:hypothetical protein